MKGGELRSENVGFIIILWLLTPQQKMISFYSGLLAELIFM